MLVFMGLFFFFTEAAVNIRNAVVDETRVGEPPGTRFCHMVRAKHHCRGGVQGPRVQARVDTAREPFQNLRSDPDDRHKHRSTPPVVTNGWRLER